MSWAKSLAEVFSNPRLGLHRLEGMLSDFSNQRDSFELIKNAQVTKAFKSIHLQGITGHLFKQVVILR